MHQYARIISIYARRIERLKQRRYVRQKFLASHEPVERRRDLCSVTYFRQEFLEEERYTSGYLRVPTCTHCTLADKRTSVRIRADFDGSSRAVEADDRSIRDDVGHDRA